MNSSLVFSEMVLIGCAPKPTCYIAPAAEQLDLGAVHRIVHRTLRDDRLLLLGSNVAMLMVLLGVVGVVERPHGMPRPVALYEQHDRVLDGMSA